MAACVDLDLTMTRPGDPGGLTAKAWFSGFLPDVAQLRRLESCRNLWRRADAAAVGARSSRTCWGARSSPASGRQRKWRRLHGWLGWGWALANAEALPSSGAFTVANKQGARTMLRSFAASLRDLKTWHGPIDSLAVQVKRSSLSRLRWTASPFGVLQGNRYMA